MNKTTLRKVFCIASLVAGFHCSCSESNAGWPNIKVLGGRSLKEAIGNGSQGPILFPKVEQERSHFAVTSPGYIDNQGRVWSGQANSGSPRHVIGQARRERHGNSLYWVTDLKNYGTIKPRYIGPANSNQPNFQSGSGSTLFPKQQSNSGAGMTQQQQYQQSLQRQQRMLQEYHDIERRTMQQATQNMLNGINRAFRQNQQNW